MEKDKHITPVIFRVEKDGTILAVFPYESHKDGYLVQCYTHIGQHCECVYHYLMYDTKPATPEQYVELKAELEGLGYIDRIRSTADERSVYVKLTPKGEKLKEEAATVPRKLLCSSGLDLEETITLLPALQKFIRQIAD